MGSTMSQKADQSMFKSHTITTAIVQQKLDQLKELVVEHKNRLDAICVSFPNQPEEDWHPLRITKYHNWRFVAEKGEHLETPLETACRIGWLPGVQLLLDNGASARHSVRKAFVHPPCALLWACKEGHPDVVRMLLQNGANVDCPHEGTNFTSAHFPHAGYSEGEDADTRTPLTVALNYQQLPVTRILIDFGANICNKVNVDGYHEEPPLTLAFFDSRMPFIQLLIAAGADILSNDWNGTMGLHFYWPGHASESFIVELLILWMKAGGTVSVDYIVAHNQDWSDHCGGGGRQVEVPKELQRYRDGTLYKMTILDKCRIVIRQKLMEHAQGRSILPAIKSLPVPVKIKNFLAFDCLED